MRHLRDVSWMMERKKPQRGAWRLEKAPPPPPEIERPACSWPRRVLSFVWRRLA